MKALEEKIIHFDCEVFAQDWLIAFHPHNSKDDEDWVEFHNDPAGLQDYILNIQDKVLCGYNVKHYDFYILKGCLLGYDPFIIKEINDFIIADGEQGWRYPFDWLDIPIPPMLDLMLDIVPPKSLKEIEGNMGLDITETTVDFNKLEKWTKKEYLEVLHYCREDVKALHPLYEVRKEYIQAKLKLADMVGLDPLKVLSLTNAKVTAEFLKADGKYTPDEGEKYEFPKNLDLKIIPQDIQDFFLTMESKFLPDGTINEDASSTYEVEIAGCPHKLGFGGLHGALLNYQEENAGAGERFILNYDVTSYYPSLMIECGYISRATEHPHRFNEAYNLRVEAKKNGDKATSEALKLVLNTTFGASNNKYNKLYDPLMAKSICVSGQLFLIDLILQLDKIPTLRLIQSNTDGIMFSVDKAQYDMVKFAISRWEKRTHFSMEVEQIGKIWQRDVNNYIMVTTTGKVKSKGGVFASYNNKDKFRGNSMSIVGEAITKFFTEGIPVERTIEECTDVEKFQIIARAGGSYDACVQETEDGLELVQKCNRIFAVKDKGKGAIKKVKLTDDRFSGKPKLKKFGKTPTDRYMKLHPELTYSHIDDDGKFVYEAKPIPFPIYPFKRGKFIARLDTVANCPKNCQIDNNNNEITIDNIDKGWYTKYTNKEISKMKGEKSDD